MPTFSHLKIANQPEMMALLLNFIKHFGILLEICLLILLINDSYECDKLSNTPKQAVITLIEKKGKDKRIICKWKPILLINVDIIMEANKILFNFIWKGKDKVNGSILIRDVGKGGLRAPHLESTI